MSTNKTNWFDVDHKGLAQLLERRGREFVVLELVSNAWDEASVTRVEVTLEPIPNRPRAKLTVEDDSPEGFRRLSDAFTLFAPSYKKGDPNARGRFNLGEKLFLALCDEASITTTTGTVRFGPEGRTVSSESRPKGSVIEAVVKMTRADIEAAEDAIRSLIPPLHVKTTFNGEELQHRIPVSTFEVPLPTESADDEGILRRTQRKATVELYEVLPDEEASIYELGIPVVETGDRWHVNVMQKVPLNMERDNVTPAYLRRVRTAVLNHNWSVIDEEDANSWARGALTDPEVVDEAVRAAVRARFGERAVAYDPSDPEANNKAMSEGFTVVHGRSLSRDEWENVKRVGALSPAGRITPSNSHIHASANGETPLDATSEQAKVMAYAAQLGEALLGHPVTVKLYRMPLTESWLAAYGSRRLMLNLTRIGKARFIEPDQHWWDALLIHEFAHENASNHLDHSFHDATCSLGAILRDVPLRISDIS